MAMQKNGDGEAKTECRGRRMGNKHACVGAKARRSKVGAACSSRSFTHPHHHHHHLLHHQQLHALAQAQYEGSHKSICLQRAPSQRSGFPPSPPSPPRNPSLLRSFSQQQQPQSHSSFEASKDSIDRPFSHHNLFNSTKVGDSSPNNGKQHFVLVHGGGYGAWCWYKSVALLEGAGFKVTAIDLTGSGKDSTDPNTITSLSLYVKPLIGFLRLLDHDEKVILVGHDFGGACISYAMEHFPKKISIAIFVTAAMVVNGQRPFDVFGPEVKFRESLFQEAQVFIYAKGTHNLPTAVGFDTDLLQSLFLNRSSPKDVALAAFLMRPIPFLPVLEKVSLSKEKYGTVRRFFIEATDDKALTPALQKRIIQMNPPEQVFRIEGSDHAPFFSKPQLLHKLFLEILQLDIEVES